MDISPLDDGSKFMIGTFLAFHILYILAISLRTSNIKYMYVNVEV